MEVPHENAHEFGRIALIRTATDPDGMNSDLPRPARCGVHAQRSVGPNQVGRNQAPWRRKTTWAAARTLRYKFNFINFKIISIYTNKYINTLKQAFKIDMILSA